MSRGFYIKQLGPYLFFILLGHQKIIFLKSLIFSYAPCISRYRVHTKNSQLNRDFYDSDCVPQLPSSYICVLLNQRMHSTHPPLETGYDSNLYSCHSLYLWLAHAEGNNSLLSLPTYCVSITYMLHTLYCLVCSLCMYNFPASLNRWADARSCLRTRVTRCICESVA
jgi:hypothetical protein